MSSIILIDLSGLARIVGKNQFDAGNSTVFEGGLGVTFLASASVALTIGGRYISGSGTSFSGLDREISGFEGLFRLQAQLPQ